MRYLHERYIWALLADRQPIEKITRSLLALELSLPSPQDFIRIEGEMLEGASRDLVTYLTNPKTILNEKRRKQMTLFLRDKGLGAFFRSDYDFQKLLSLRQRPDIRSALESLTLSDMKDAEIVTLVVKRFHLAAFDTEDLNTYRLFFFDSRWMDAESWHYHLTEVQEDEAKLKILALRSPENLDYLRWKAGFPVELEYSTMLRKVMNDAFFSHQELNARPDKDPSALNVFTGILTRVGDRLDKFQSELGQHATESLHLEITRVRSLSTKASPIHSGKLPVIPIEATAKSLVLLPSKGLPEGKKES